MSAVKAIKSMKETRNRSPTRSMTPPSMEKKDDVFVNEIKVGYMILAQALAALLKSLIRKNFNYWAQLYASRYNQHRFVRANTAASEIQNWYKTVKVTSRQSWQRLQHAIQMCLHRRKAIKSLLNFEMGRRKALVKIHRCIALRRRCHFASRSMERITRWKLLLRKTHYRIVRNAAARHIQRWRRMVASRPEKDRMLILLIIRCGGYSIVRPKIPARHISRGFLEGVNACISQLQKAWFASKGQMALYMLFAARRARLAYEAMLNENATKIQYSWRAYLWIKLMLAAITHNRARRMFRVFRHYQYRKWLRPNKIRRKHRMAIRIQKLFKKNHWLYTLKVRFKLRKALLIFTRAKKTMSAIYIQRAYRSHVAWEKWKKEEARKFYAQQRQKGEIVIKNVCKIQLNWRRNKQPPTSLGFPRHVTMTVRRIKRRQNLQLYIFAMNLQRLARKWLDKRHKALAAKRLKAANTIWRIAKTYVLKQAVWDRVQGTMYKKNKVASVMKKCFRKYLFWRCIKLRCAIRKAINNYYSLQNNAVRRIQRFLTNKITQYYSAVRIAGRRQLKKRRERDAIERFLRIKQKAARFIQHFFKYITYWKQLKIKIDIIRKAIARANLEKKSAISISKYVKYAVAWKRYNRAIKAKYDRIEAERIKREHTLASNTVGKYWRRHKEKYQLNKRFVLRKKMIDVYNELKTAREIAEYERKEALEDVKRTEENMQATIAASWHQGSDATGRNYYYNYVTGESSWIPPEGWKGRALTTWIRNMDERLNVYYYNQQTGESSWLPPCVSCGEQGQRYCAECDVAYCVTCYELNHNEDCDESMQNHTWSLTEYERDVLKAGEVYCIDCKRRTATKVCNTCWDPYCDDCFKYAHHAGNLRLHKGIAYKRAKAGWMVVKARIAGESDYYVNGTTGVTTFEKPEEFLSESELVHKQNFLVHKQNAEELIKQVEKLQYDLESACYERDTVIFDALNGGGKLGEILAKRNAKKKATKSVNMLDSLQSQGDVVLQAQVKNAEPPGFFTKLFYGDKREYRGDMLNPDDRRRGAEKTEYIKSLIDDVENPKKK